MPEIHAQSLSHGKPTGERVLIAKEGEPASHIPVPGTEIQLSAAFHTPNREVLITATHGAALHGHTEYIQPGRKKRFDVLLESVVVYHQNNGSIAE